MAEALTEEEKEERKKALVIVGLLGLTALGLALVFGSSSDDEHDDLDQRIDDGVDRHLRDRGIVGAIEERPDGRLVRVPGLLDQLARKSGVRWGRDDDEDDA